MMNNKLLTTLLQQISLDQANEIVEDFKNREKKLSAIVSNDRLIQVLAAIWKIKEVNVAEIENLLSMIEKSDNRKELLTSFQNEVKMNGTEPPPQSP